MLSQDVSSLPNSISNLLYSSNPPLNCIIRAFALIQLNIITQLGLLMFPLANSFKQLLNREPDIHNLRIDILDKLSRHLVLRDSLMEKERTMVVRTVKSIRLDKAYNTFRLFIFKLDDAFVCGHTE